MSEEIINALARLPDLRVVARTSAFAFEGKDADVRTIGEQLGVRNVVEGSVRRSGERLRVTAQLISVADGYHLWSETYERDVADVFAIQEEPTRATPEPPSIGAPPFNRRGSDPSRSPARECLRAPSGSRDRPRAVRGP
jgi:TolB-like protein